MRIYFRKRRLVKIRRTGQRCATEGLQKNNLQSVLILIPGFRVPGFVYECVTKRGRILLLHISDVEKQNKGRMRRRCNVRNWYRDIAKKSSAFQEGYIVVPLNAARTVGKYRKDTGSRTDSKSNFEYTGSRFWFYEIRLQNMNVLICIS